MTIVNDEAVFNVAGTQGDWTATDFDPSQDNNSSSAVQINREGTACQEWVLKENITTGNVRTSTLGGTKDISNGEVVVFWFFVTSDADFDKLTLFRLRLSSDTGFTTNYAEWDAKAQIENLDLYGWFPVTVYPANPDATAGTIVYSSIDSIGWVASTGGTGTKLTGFDQSHSVSYIGGHSQTVTLANLKADNDTNDLGVMFQFGDFLKSSVNIRLGGGTTANTVFNETNKGLFFDNIEPEHNLGFIFVDNTSGTTTFDLDGWAVSWNQQSGTTPEIFTDAQHTDIFRINSCTFARGGLFTCRAWISDANTFVTNTTINNCDCIDPNNLLFRDNSITDSRVTAADNGAMLIDASGTARISNLSFTRGSSSHAIVITATGTYDFTNFTYSGYGSDDTDTATIRNESGGAVTINILGGDTPTVDDRLAGSTTTLVINPVTITVNVTDSGGTNIQNARVFVETAATIASGEIFEAAVTSITQAAGTATLTTTAAHGLETGDKVVIRKAQPDGYNKVATATVTSTTVFTYPVDSGLSSPATGTPVVSYVAIQGLTDVNGDISVTRSWAAAQQMKGWARLKNTVSPFYQDADISFAVNTTAGNTVNAVLQPDE